MLSSSLASLFVTLAETAAVVQPSASAPVEEKAPPLIDIDGTVLVQFGIFVVMYLVLRHFLFVPYLRMRAEREAHIEGAEKTAQELLRKRETLDAEYQQRVQKARAGAEDERTRLQAEGRAREAEVLGLARTRAQARISETTKKIAAEVKTAQAELAKQAEPLARSLANKLLGREVA
jgi:F-type H+-transporting ATPase subunit b